MNLCSSLVAGTVTSILETFRARYQHGSQISGSWSTRIHVKSSWYTAFDHRAISSRSSASSFVPCAATCQCSDEHRRGRSSCTEARAVDARLASSIAVVPSLSMRSVRILLAFAPFVVVCEASQRSSRIENGEANDAVSWQGGCIAARPTPRRTSRSSCGCSARSACVLRTRPAGDAAHFAGSRLTRWKARRIRAAHDGSPGQQGTKGHLDRRCGRWRATQTHRRSRERQRSAVVSRWEHDLLHFGSYERVFMRHWDAWSDGRHSQLFLVPSEGGTPIRVSAGLEGDVPSKPFGGVEEIAFVPDGSGIVFMMRTAGRDEPWSTNFDLFLAPVDGSAKPRSLTENNHAWDTRPVFSPDGTHRVLRRSRHCSAVASRAASCAFRTRTLG